MRDPAAGATSRGATVDRLTFTRDRDGEGIMDSNIHIEVRRAKQEELEFVSADRYTSPARCGAGILTAIERDMVSAGYAYFYSSVTANEPPPQEWHRRMGFSECGYIAGVNAGGIEEIFFQKSLTE